MDRGKETIGRGFKENDDRVMDAFAIIDLYMQFDTFWTHNSFMKINLLRKMQKWCRANITLYENVEGQLLDNN